jgi:AcrR family transcriptional regulator
MSQHGYRGASLRGIAGDADIQPATIFHHFPGGKEELVRRLFEHIMETIATRMTPTIGSGTTLAPADLVVQCAALLWDFLGEHPEYAGVLMRGTLEPAAPVSDLIEQYAVRVVEMAITYFETCQKEGELGDFDARRLLFRMSSFVISYHGAPSMRRYILGEDVSSKEERLRFLETIKAEIEP